MKCTDIRIALFHSNQLFRESLGCCLAQMESIFVSHAASSLEEAIDVLRLHRPDVFILEFGLFGRGGVDQSARVCALSSEVKTLVIDVPDTESDILYCIESGGASGYLLRNASVEDLVNNIKAIARGETLCSPRIASLTFCRMSRLAHQREDVRAASRLGLTRREAEIVALIENGLSNKDIAVRLQIEVSTVKNHIHNILDKAHLHDRHSLVEYVKQQHVTTPRF